MIQALNFPFDPSVFQNSLRFTPYFLCTSQYGMPQLSDKERSGKYMKVSI